MVFLRSVAFLLLICPLGSGATPACLRDLLPNATLPESGPDQAIPDAPSQHSKPPAPQTSSSNAGSQAAADKGRGLPATERNFFRNLAHDQKVIWTSPFHLKPNDATWLVPFGGITAGLIAGDARAMQLEKSRPKDIRLSKNIANGGLAGLGLLAGGMYTWGLATDNPHARETGVLSLEAAANSMIVANFLKSVTLRDRPDVHDGRGSFFSSGAPLGSSFPSEQTMLAWSTASVIAHEYPGWFTKLAVYGAATAVTVSRVSARKHFPADVAVAAPLGWLIGRQVYRSHHDPDVGGTDIGVVVGDQDTTQWGRFSCLHCLASSDQAHGYATYSIASRLSKRQYSIGSNEASTQYILLIGLRQRPASRDAGAAGHTKRFVSRRVLAAIPPKHGVKRT